MRRVESVVLCLLLAVVIVSGVTYDLTPQTSNWINTLSNLQAGDTAILHAGTYSKTAKLSLRLLGTASAPIVIKGASGEARPIIYHTDASQNIIDLVEGNYFTIQYLELTGGSLGLRLGPSATNTINNGLIQNLTIRDLPETAISANFPGHTYSNLTFRYNEIYNTGSNTGECLYLGCVNGDCIIHDSTVSNNWLHDTLDATSGSVGAAIQIKDKSYNNLVEDNVCWNLGGPCVLLYTDGGLGRNRVIGNVMLGGNDLGIQAAAGATIINNIVMNTGADGIGIILNPANAVIANVTIQHNTVVNASTYCLRTTNFVPANNFLIANNAFYCPNSQSVYASGSQAGVPYYNNGYLGGSPPSGVAAGAFFALGSIAADLQGVSATSYNVYPKAGSKLLNAGNAAYGVGYDFNYNRRRSPPTVGAYEEVGPTNPGWPVTKSFKNNNVNTGPSASSNPGLGSSSPTISTTSTTSASNAASISRTPAASGSSSDSISLSATNSISISRSPSTSVSNAASVSRTPAASASSSASISLSGSNSISVSNSITPSMGSSPTSAASITPSISGTSAASVTSSISISLSGSNSISVSNSITPSTGSSPTSAASATNSISTSAILSISTLGASQSFTSSVSFSRSTVASASFSRAPGVSDSTSVSRAPGVSDSSSMTASASTSQSQFSEYGSSDSFYYDEPSAGSQLFSWLSMLC